MPAERTRGLKRTESDGQRLVWIMPVEPTDPSGVSFTPNVTPVSYNDGPPPLVDVPPMETIMFPPTDDSSGSRRPTHSKKKPENHIPRPPNAFILFRSSFIKSQHVSTEVETNHSTLSKIIGLTWQNLPEKERQVWHAKAKAALEEHKRKFPQYAFRPTQTKKGGTAEKRKVREVEPKDMKRCAKIAEFLAAGLKGQELDAAMAEFDRNHVPEIVTRFEAPITARTYRRSSSAPIPDTENSKSNQSFFSTVTNARKIRASSTLPTRFPTPEITNVDHASLKKESSFDFSSFSFDKTTSPLPTFACDPLNDVAPPSPADSSASHPDTLPASLSVDTSAYFDNWNQCTTPITPATPDFLGSPSPTPSYTGPYGTYSSSLEKTHPHLSNVFPTYQQCGLDMGLPNESYLSHPSEYTTFHPHHNDSALSQIDIDFSSFINATPLHSYQL
ncbi:Repressor ROX1 [Leucoagaricus sp. SymC.cos]|nr:Repressor ROX1 [Leucoagaricus sp. SymC.cos]